MTDHPLSPALAHRLSEAARCPDCASDVTMSVDGGTLLVTVAQCDTCPRWRRMEAEDSAG